MTDVEASEAPADERRTRLLTDLTTALGDAVLEHHLIPGRDLWLRIAADRWVDVVRACRDDVDLGYFDFLTGLDWMIAPWGRYENTAFDTAGVADDGASTIDDAADGADAEADGDAATAGGGGISLPEGPGYAGGTGRFQVLLRLHSIRRGVGVNLKVDLDDDHPEIATLTGLFAGADWHERVAYEMFGFIFLGHPHLAKFYLPSDFEGSPMRKDFPLLSRVVKPWPGVVDVEPIPEHLEAELEAAVMAAEETAS